MVIKILTFIYTVNIESILWIRRSNKNQFQFRGSLKRGPDSRARLATPTEVLTSAEEQERKVTRDWFEWMNGIQHWIKAGSGEAAARSSGGSSEAKSRVQTMRRLGHSIILLHENQETVTIWCHLPSSSRWRTLLERVLSHRTNITVRALSKYSTWYIICILHHMNNKPWFWCPLTFVLIVCKKWFRTQELGCDSFF